MSETLPHPCLIIGDLPNLTEAVRQTGHEPVLANSTMGVLKILSVMESKTSRVAEPDFSAVFLPANYSLTIIANVIDLRGFGIAAPIFLVDGDRKTFAPLKNLGVSTIDSSASCRTIVQLIDAAQAARNFVRKSSAIYSFSIEGANITLNSETRRMKNAANQKDERLTEKQMAIFVRLLEADHHTIFRPVLLQEVFWHEGAKTHTIETHVSRLRKTIEIVTGINSAQAVIVGVHGGYRISDNVTINEPILAVNARVTPRDLWDKAGKAISEAGASSAETPGQPHNRQPLRAPMMT